MTTNNPDVTKQPDAPAASPPADGSACPHCGGTTGVMYRKSIRGTQWDAWDGTAISFTDDSAVRGFKRCADCGRKITPNGELSSEGPT